MDLKEQKREKLFIHKKLRAVYNRVNERILIIIMFCPKPKKTTIENAKHPKCDTSKIYF